MRTPHETLREVHLQLKYAVVYAGTGKVETSLRTTGVKDPLASVVAQRLLRLGIDMRKPIAAEIEEGAAEGGDGEEGAAGGGDVDIAEREVNAATEPPSEKEPAKPKITSAQRIRKHLEDLLALAMEKDPINPLLTAPGGRFSSTRPTLSLTCTSPKASIFIKTPRQNYYIPSYSGSLSTSGARPCLSSRRNQSSSTYSGPASTLWNEAA